MILMDEMIPMKLYSSKQKAYLPFNPTNKRKGSLVTLLTRDIDDSIDLMKMPFFNNPSYYTSYYLDRNVKRYLSNDGNIQIEGEEEDPNVIEEAVMRKIDRNSPTITCYGNANDKRLLKKDSISLKKLVAYCNALDITATLTLKDANSDVPNPMGKEITYDLNNTITDGDDE